MKYQTNHRYIIIPEQNDTECEWASFSDAYKQCPRLQEFAIVDLASSFSDAYNFHAIHLCYMHIVEGYEKVKFSS